MHALAALPRLAVLAPLALALTDGAADAAGADAATAVVMNPFGVLFVALTWALLVALNLWCLRRLLKHRQVSRGDASQA